MNKSGKLLHRLLGLGLTAALALGVVVMPVNGVGMKVQAEQEITGAVVNRGDVVVQTQYAYDCQRYPAAYPVSEEPFTLSHFQNPYLSRANQIDSTTGPWRLVYDGKYTDAPERYTTLKASIQRVNNDFHVGMTDVYRLYKDQSLIGFAMLYGTLEVAAEGNEAATKGYFAVLGDNTSGGLGYYLTDQSLDNSAEVTNTVKSIGANINAAALKNETNVGSIAIEEEVLPEVKPADKTDEKPAEKSDEKPEEKPDETPAEKGTSKEEITVKGDEEESTKNKEAKAAVQEKKPEKTPNICNHVYEADVNVTGSENEDIEVNVRCKYCGAGKESYTIPNSAYSTWNTNVAKKILKASKDANVVIETDKWTAFHQMVEDAMEARPDVSMTVRYTVVGGKDNGKRRQLQIPSVTAEDTVATAKREGMKDRFGNKFCGFGNLADFEVEYEYGRR